MERRHLLHLLVAHGGMAMSAPLVEALGMVRARTDTLLETQSISLAGLETWEQLPYDYGRLQLRTPAFTFLAQTLSDFAELRGVLSRRQPLEIQKRLYRVMAQLAGLIAITVNDVSSARESLAWLHTARLAADETGDRALRAWITARQGMLYLWYERPAERAVELTRTAQALAGTMPSPTAALALAMEARAQAKLGRRREALLAVARAEGMFERLRPEDTRPSILGFDAHRMRWCLQNALTQLGETSAAMAMQREARQLSDIDLALVAFDRATCLVRDGDLDAGFTAARQAYAGLPSESRTGLVRYRAEAVAGLAGPSDRSLEPVRELRALIAAA